jgi:hypothetical protein
LAYEVAIKLLESVRDAKIRDAHLRDQAMRAPKSTVLNTAEAAGRVTGADCPAAARDSPRQGAEHPLDAGGQYEDAFGDAALYDAERGGEIDCANDLMQRVVRDLEVTAPHPRAVARQSLADTEERALARSRRLVTQLGITNARLVHAPRELLRGNVDIQPLKGEKVVVHVCGSMPPPSEKTVTANNGAPRAARSWRGLFAHGMEPQT